VVRSEEEQKQRMFEAMMGILFTIGISTTMVSLYQWIRGVIGILPFIIFSLLPISILIIVMYQRSEVKLSGS